MTCPPFCDTCGGNLGHPANGDWTCAKCKRRESIIHGLRSQGWDRIDAENEADERISRSTTTTTTTARKDCHHVS